MAKHESHVRVRFTLKQPSCCGASTTVTLKGEFMERASKKSASTSPSLPRRALSPMSQIREVSQLRKEIAEVQQAAGSRDILARERFSLTSPISSSVQWFVFNSAQNTRNFVSPCGSGEAEFRMIFST